MERRGRQQPSSRRFVPDPQPARLGFVSTNSIVQGEQVAQLWPLLFKAGAEIAFAHRTFVWPGRAAVHCVIVGLAQRGDQPAEKRLFSYADAKGEPTETRHGALTAYLFDAKEADRHLVVKKVSKPVNGAPKLNVGSKPVDGGYLIFTAAERASLLRADPAAEAFLRPYIGAKEFLNGGVRYIMVAQSASPSELRGHPTLIERLKMVRRWRSGEIPKRAGDEEDEARSAESTRYLAETPSEFHVTVLPTQPYLVVPENGSETREYVPAGWLSPPIVPSSLVRISTAASIWHFALITSHMHMVWVNNIGGRLKSDPRYSIKLVYNTFPWPQATPAQRSQIEALAQAVLDARALPKNGTSTLADLYDPDTMPAELRRAHRELDTAVDRLYRRAPFASDRERVEHLFTLYQRLVDPLQNEGVRQNRRVARRKRAATASNEESAQDG